MVIFEPALRAIGQISDRVFLGVVVHSVFWAAVAFLGLAAGSVWGVQHLLAGQGWLAWVAAVAGGVGSALLALVLFLPLATVIASLFIDRIAAAVEARHYPWLPPARPARLGTQIWDSVALGLKVLLLQVLALLLTVLVPGLGFALGWMVSAWAIGKGLFVAVAMRRMTRAEAHGLYRARRPLVLVQGGLMSAGSLVPVLNLLTPVLGTAAMVHVLHLPGSGLWVRAPV